MHLQLSFLGECHPEMVLVQLHTLVIAEFLHRKCCWITSLQQRKAAIHQITPLINIAQLKHGNIGNTGNITCVWQKSNLVKVFPNLPSQCIQILIVYCGQRGNQVVDLPPYCCAKWNILCALQLYMSLEHEA